MKLTKIAAVLITTLGLSSAAFASEIPQPPIYNPDSIINKLPPATPEDPNSPPEVGEDGEIKNKPGYGRQESYDAAQILGEQVDKNTGAIKEANDKLDTAISKGQTALDSTNEKLDTAISKGQTALDSTNEKLDTAI
ncbi:hypothetical protein RZ760_020630, partial [Providencia rettgeri]|nr:hypothetical protein [Providencia rettgeri]